MQESIKRSHEETVRQKESAKAAQSFGASWAKHAVEHHGCKVCRRTFATEVEKDAFVKRFQGSECALTATVGSMSTICRLLRVSYLGVASNAEKLLCSVLNATRPPLLLSCPLPPMHGSGHAPASPVAGLCWTVSFPRS